MVPFVALAIAAVLATAGPDSVARIPGTTMSLGMPEARLKELGTFVDVKADDAQGATARRGDARFFGVPCSATLYLRDGRLARVRFETQSVAPHAAAYVEDQLLRSRLLRECRRLEPGSHDCDWLGKVKIHLVLQGSGLTATAEWPQRPWETEAEAPVAAATPTTSEPAATPATQSAAPVPPAASATAPPPTTAPAKEPATAAPTPAKAAEPAVTKPVEPAPTKETAPAAGRKADETAPATKSTPAATLPLPTPPLKSAPATTMPVPAPVVAMPPATRPAAPAGGVAAPQASMPPAAMLPETLRLSLPERNPPSVWPRMLALPQLDYPEAARSKSVQGVVWVLALVDTAGAVRSTRIDRGIPGLNEAALAWVAKAHFAPCVRDGALLSFWIRVAVRFTLS